MTPEHQALVERGRKVWTTFFYPKRTDFLNDDSIELKPATYLQMADCLRLALDDIEALTAERDEAIRDRNGHAEHVLRMAKECEDGLAALTEIDTCWEACGLPGNRGKLSLSEQISSLSRECEEAQASADTWLAEHKVSSARTQALEAALTAAADDLHRLMRTAEMSSGIMQDRRRTGNWPGAQKTADAFDRIGLRAAEAKAALRAVLTPAVG